MNDEERKDPQLGEAWESAGQSLENAASAAQESLGETVGQPVEAAQQNLENAVSAVQESLGETIGQPVEAAQQGFESAVSAAQESLGEAIGQPAEAAQQSLENAASAARESLGETIGQPVEAAQQSLENAVSAAQESLGEAIGQPVEAAQQSLENAVSAAQESLGEAIGQPVEAAGQGFEDLSSGAAASFQDWEAQAPAWGGQPAQPEYGGQPAYQPQPGYNPQPEAGAPQGPAVYAGAPVYQPVAVKPKKKMATGLKVFLIVACVLAALAILGFGAYLATHMVQPTEGGSVIQEYIEEFPFDGDFDGLPFGGRDDEDDRPSRPEEGGGEGFGRRDENGGFGGGASSAPEEDGGDSQDGTPDFGVTPPDVDDPVPDIDVTPSDGIEIKKASGKELSAKEVYERVVKSTVTVAVTREVGGSTQTGTGTGIIASSDGYIITNSHVVLNSKSSRVRITTYDGQEVDAVVVGVDRSTDLAVLKTNDYDFTPAEFGDSDDLAVGDVVIAIGNPGGARFSGSMTGGYVSGLDREVGAYSENGMTYIQTDAAINPGNSGGPLVNLYGQVVGINSSKIVSSAYEGMGFAIPVSKAKTILDQLMNGGYVKGRVRMGITGTDVSNTNYVMMGVSGGFLITDINADSAFAGTDAQAGDVIVAIDGEEVTKLEEISNLLLKYAPGDTVTVTLLRLDNTGSATFDVEITLLEDKGETQQ